MKIKIQSSLIFISTCMFALILAAIPTLRLNPSGSREREDISDARLLVFKEVLNNLIVENMDIVIKYSIFNVGATSANKVLLKDSTIDSDFTVVGGQTKVNFIRIPPRVNVTHTLVIRPLKSGYYNFTSAQISYTSGENSKEVIRGWSSEPGEIYITPFKEFDKKFSPHYLDWPTFAIMSAFPLAIPFLLWYSSKAKYEAIVLPKKAKYN